MGVPRNWGPGVEAPLFLELGPQFDTTHVVGFYHEEIAKAEYLPHRGKIGSDPSLPMADVYPALLYSGYLETDLPMPAECGHSHFSGRNNARPRGRNSPHPEVTTISLEPPETLAGKINTPLPPPIKFPVS